MDAETDRTWRVDQRRRELSYADLNRRLDRSHKIKLMIGLPAVILFALGGMALHKQLIADEYAWLAWAACVTGLVLMSVVPAWPAPRERAPAQFDAEATFQVDLELARADKTPLAIVD